MHPAKLKHNKGCQETYTYWVLSKIVGKFEVISSPCKRQCELLPSLDHLTSVIRRPLTCHILIFSSETPQPNEVKLGSPWRLLILSRSINRHGRHRQLLFLIGWFLEKIVSSKIALPNKSKLGRKHPRNVLYRDC